MKKCSYLLLFVLCLFLGINGVEAKPIGDECINNNTCKAICSYNIVYNEKGSFSHVTDSNEIKKITRRLSIYYIYDSDNIKMKWDIGSSNYVTASGNLANGKGLSKNNGEFVSVTWPNSTPMITAKSFTCPKYAYVGYDSALASSNSFKNKLCFDNDGSTCLKITTGNVDYSRKNTFSSSKMEYDISEEMGGDVGKEDLDKQHKEENEDVSSKLFNCDIGGTCDSYLGAINDKNAPAYYLHFAFNLLKYAAILMLFIFTVVDFAKAIPSGKDDALPSALKNTLKRFIIAVIIFFIPIIIDFVFQVLGITSSTSCVTGK